MNILIVFLISFNFFILLKAIDIIHVILKRKSGIGEKELLNYHLDSNTSYSDSIVKFMDFISYYDISPTSINDPIIGNVDGILVRSMNLRQIATRLGLGPSDPLILTYEVANNDDSHHEESKNASLPQDSISEFDYENRDDSYIVLESTDETKDKTEEMTNQDSDHGIETLREYYHGHKVCCICTLFILIASVLGTIYYYTIDQNLN